MGSEFLICWLSVCDRMVWNLFQGRSAQHRAFPRIQPCFQEWILIFDHFKWTCHEASTVCTTAFTNRKLFMHGKKHSFWILHLTGRSEIYNSSAKLRNTWHQHRRPAEAEKPFAGSSHSRNKLDSLKINQNSARFSANHTIIHIMRIHLVVDERIVLHS